MECENSTYARDGKMESPGGVTTVPARRVSVIHIEMVTQTRAGVKVQGYGPTLPLYPRHWHLSQHQAYTLDPRSAGWACQCRYSTG